MKKLILSFVFFLSLVTPQISQATYGETGEMEFGAYGGYSLLDDYSGANLKNGFLVGGRFGFFIDDQVSFEPSYQFDLTKTGGPGSTNAQIRSARFNLLYNFMSGRKFRPFFTGGLGWEWLKFSGGGESHDLGVNAGFGFRYMFREWIGARADARYVYTDVGAPIGERAHNFEFMLGVTFMHGGTPKVDSDGDGVYDKKDKCANTPSGAKVDATGCPEDADQDGVADGVDECPNTQKGLIVDERGCKQDSDKDGVPDGIDRCPESAEGVKVNSFGCSTDDDADGVGNKEDKCPNTPAGAPVDTTGCPTDLDGDNVFDYKDKCPNTAEGKEVDEMGCPKESNARGVLKGVKFKPGKAELTLNSHAILDGVATELSQFPDLNVEIQGYTDSQGSAAMNKRLSEARAQSVADYLAGKGIDPNRLQVKGFGEENPIADNATPAGRAENRRVEVNWLDQ